MVNVTDVVIIKCDLSLLVEGIYFSFLSSELFFLHLRWQKGNIFQSSEGLVWDQIILLNDT